MNSHLPVVALLLFTLTSCTAAAPPKPSFSGQGGSTENTFSAKADGTQNNGPGVANRMAAAEPSLIELSNTKFAGKDNSLEAVVKYSGLTSDRLKFTATGNKVTLTVPGLPVSASDVLIVEIYEKAKLRFVAKRANTAVEVNKSNSWAFADCAITKVPWDGEGNEATCGWAIEASK